MYFNDEGFHSKFNVPWSILQVILFFTQKIFIISALLAPIVPYSADYFAKNRCPSYSF